MNFIKRYFRGKLNEIRDWQSPDREENPMKCPEITLPDIDKPLYDKLLAEATAAGMQSHGNMVSIEGLYFDWNYDAEAAVLHVTCLKKPFFIGCDRVETEIRGLVEKAKKGDL